MSEHGDKTLDRIAAVYADVRREHPQMPTWENIGSEMRMAFIAIYFAGRRDRLAEQAGR